MTPEKTAKGQCFCGNLVFEVDLPTKWCAHCHCSMCRRAHGAAFVTWVGAESSHFRLLSGQDQLHWFASSKDAKRGFCQNCGSTLFFESDRWPGEVHITLANFLEPIDRAPQAHAFWDTHVDWLEIGDPLPKISSVT